MAADVAPMPGDKALFSMVWSAGEIMSIVLTQFPQNIPCPAQEWSIRMDNLI